MNSSLKRGWAPYTKTFMLPDVEAKRKTEVEIFAGKVMELGKKHAVPTPVNETIHRILRVTEHYLKGVALSCSPEEGRGNG